MAPQTTARRTFPTGTCIDIQFADADVDDARYLVQGEYEKFGGLKVKRVRGGYDSTLPRYCGSLFPDENTLRDNFAEEETERTGEPHPEEYDIERIDVVDLDERIRVEGEFTSPRAAHVKRAVIDAIETINTPDIARAADPETYDIIAGTEWVHPEEVTIQAAGERSDSDCVVLAYNASMDLQTEEKIRETVREHLKDDYDLETKRSGVWEFRYDMGRPVR